MTGRNRKFSLMWWLAIGGTLDCYYSFYKKTKLEGSPSVVCTGRLYPLSSCHWRAFMSTVACWWRPGGAMVEPLCPLLPAGRVVMLAAAWVPLSLVGAHPCCCLSVFSIVARWQSLETLQDIHWVQPITDSKNSINFLIAWLVIEIFNDLHHP